MAASHSCVCRGRRLATLRGAITCPPPPTPSAREAILEAAIDVLSANPGAGLDVVFSSPEALDYDRFEATASGVSTVPLAAGGLVWQLQVEPSLRLELSVGAEVDLIDVHYDVVAGDGTTELVSRWPVRPSASIGLELF